ncbi:glucan 1,3-beta-glucosidase [Cryptococcus neoformans AD2-60a]|nr:glucan 1,3-beta-glucosidase [Cryptococcus neoformans var. grubii AD2-60a]OXC87302.1 glucan 1,3-beta-glucosidase [Cryptococcus neoformans var. grubii AD1-7a]OXH40064.1 glucan 1,3-beta-glucosidase [Cryptococcus neoformans var. grubii]
MWTNTLPVLTFAVFFAHSARALSSWYTEPGGTPTGSVDGDKVRGVNLGGWFILENWMMPSFFEDSVVRDTYINDEWSFCLVLGQDECLARLQQHWDTYITEDDFKRFANYSLNTVRIPMGYWAWTTPEDYEPYIQGQLPYLERALNWSSWYGLDVMLDLHGLPGGANGQDNQGYKGPIEFQLNSTNMDRAMGALANMTQYVTSEKFDGVVKAIELTNEPYILEYSSRGMDFYTLADFYVKGYQVVRANENIIDGANEIMVVIHDAFQPLLNWRYFWGEESLGLNWTNYALDTHIYDAFGGADQKSYQEHLDTICALSASIAEAQQYFPVIVGEFALGVNTYCVDYQSCWGLTIDEVIANFTSTYEASLFLRQFWEVQSDVYELGAGWIFWSVHHELAGPWSWTQSAAQNWVPMDPSEKIWPFNPDASSYCLDTFNPLEGDQNLPYFPSYANNYTNIDISSVKPVKLNANPAPDSTGASATSSSTTSRSQSSTASPSGSSSESGSLYTAPLPSSLILLFMMVMVVSVSRL